MQKIVFIVFLSSLLLACQSEKERIADEHTVVDTDQSEAVIPNQVATMEIDGMACVMSCGSSIKKELKKTNGVSSVEFDFETGRETNIATISYNDELISEEEIVRLISEINDQQFTVGETSSKSIHTNTATSEAKCPYTERSQVEALSSTIEMPNLLDILSGLLPG
ncbi:MAG: heavy-metal-associated domain-containing protein [Fluviicola sp.]|nr:heavy-metal-associated domain-containing protein [Fluviicola sp.]